MQSNPRKIGFVLAASQHGSLIVNRLDFNPSATQIYGIAEQLLEHGGWDPTEMRTLLLLLHCRRQFYGDGVTMIDCGANIGVLTVAAASEMTGWGSVLAIEAQERLFYALAGNIALNNCFNARALHAAVAAEDGTMAVPVPNYLERGSFGSLELRPSPRTEFIGQEIDYSPAAMQPIRTLTLDSLRLNRVDVIKIDVEGMEMEVLAGAAATIAQHQPLMLVEWIKTSRERLTEKLESLGYRVFSGAINLLAVHASDRGLVYLKESLAS